MQLHECLDRTTWDAFINANPYGHPLQLWGWGEVKKANGWSAHRLYLADGDRWEAAAQVLTWPIPGTRQRVAYVPRGPVVDPGSVSAKVILRELASWAKERKLMYLRVEPDWLRFKFEPGWVKSNHHIEMNKTYRLDLKKAEDEMLEAMGRKHRQYIRGAERDGVVVKQKTDGTLDGVYEIYLKTAKRAGFGLHDLQYYERVRAELGGNSRLLVAEFEGEVVAFLWLGTAGRTAYELYGGMDETAAKMHANYALKWRAFLAMKEAGYEIYDFNGRVTEGVSSFKAGFGPEEVDLVDTYDYPVGKVKYQVWEKLWPVAKPIGRRVMKLRRGGKGEARD
jgi:peptidoglycan pentaglycine glycine transferase (the first glycine)